MAARLGNVAFDCRDVLATARFWSAVLGRPLDEGSSAQFATIGGADVRRGEPAWYFNKVSENKSVTNRLHLDLIDSDLAAIEKLVALGATVLANHSFGSHHWTVMHDPEGNDSCIAAEPFTG